MTPTQLAVAVMPVLLLCGCNDKGADQPAAEARSTAAVERAIADVEAAKAEAATPPPAAAPAEASR